MQNQGENEQMNATFTMPANVLLGMSHLGSTNEMMRNITGVLIEKRDGDIRLVATDGHMMGIYNVMQDGIEWFDGASGRESVVVDVGNFISLLKEAKKSRISTMKITLNGTVKIEHFGKTVESPYLDVTFPDWEIYIPKETNIPIPNIGIQFSLLDKMKKAIADLSGSKEIYLCLSFSGTTSAMKVTSGADPNFTGILMPARV